MSKSEDKGAIAWMASNSVASNLLMLFLLLGGILVSQNVEQRIFPKIEIDEVHVSVAYPGATPEEVEQGVIRAIEEATRGVEGVKEINSWSHESSGFVNLELEMGVDRDKALADVRSAVSQITSFPVGIEPPEVRSVDVRHDIATAALYGDLPAEMLYAQAEKLRDELLQHPAISTVHVTPWREREVKIEISQDTMRSYGITLDEVAQVVRRHSTTIPGGILEGRDGQLLLTTGERIVDPREFGSIAVRHSEHGTPLLLADIATIRSGFRHDYVESRFDSYPAVRITAMENQHRTPSQVADGCRETVDDMRPDLPPGMQAAMVYDQSEMLGDRMRLMFSNATLGLILVLISLGAFLNFRLAFWVSMGIPISFMGAVLLMEPFGLSINMVSLFAFIVALGLVVDDAIVVGENIHTRRQQGERSLEASINGAREVSAPVFFAILTTIVAFTPIFFSGNDGFAKVAATIPAIVILVLIISLVESFFILPAHLAHTGGRAKWGWLRFIEDRQAHIGDALQRFNQTTYRRILEKTLHWRYLCVAISFVLFALALSTVQSGWMPINVFPNIDGDWVIVDAELEYGSPPSETRRVRNFIESAAQKVRASDHNPDSYRALIVTSGASWNGGAASHKVAMGVYLPDPDERGYTASQFAAKWRKAIGNIPEIEKLELYYTTGPSGGDAISIGFEHNDQEVLRQAAEKLAAALEKRAGVQSIDPGIANGKVTWEISPTEQARQEGLTEATLGAAIRGAVYGVEATRQQQGRHQVRTFVKLKPEGTAEQALDELLIAAPSGRVLPLKLAADYRETVSDTKIRRNDGKRMVYVRADVDENTANAGEINEYLEEEVVPQILSEHPGLTSSVGGQGESTEEFYNRWATQTGLVLLVIFALLAIPFRSYIQPIIIMTAIPMGLIGTVIGHFLMGYEMSIMSALGFTALTGVVINDSLILIVKVNELARNGSSHFEAALEGSILRFRPIFLTTLTTTAGLLPMLLETSTQARFLIPMAVSLAFGLVFATGIILLLVPSTYLIVEDIRALLSGPKEPKRPRPEGPAPATS